MVCLGIEVQLLQQSLQFLPATMNVADEDEPPLVRAVALVLPRRTGKQSRIQSLDVNHSGKMRSYVGPEESSSSRVDVFVQGRPHGSLFRDERREYLDPQQDGGYGHADQDQKESPELGGFDNGRDLLDAVLDTV
jgi:hypothetical protein